MVMYTVGGPGFIPTVQAQTAPVGAGFELDAGDLRFILRQIGIAEAHAAGGALFGPGPSQVNDYRFPFGLRTVDGSFNHLRPGSETNGASDQLFPRLTTPNFRQAESLTAAEAALVGQAAGPTAYTQKSGFVADSQPRVISNLIIDQTANNPAALFVASALAGEDAPTADPDSFTLPILNTAPDVGLSAPFNSMFTFFGQFFDHGLDLTNKGGGTVFVPLKADDSLLNVGPNFMMLTRATNQPGPDGILGNADDVQEATNQTTPFVDQNQTYTSHPSHQVFLREYRMSAGRPVSTGKMIDGGGNTASGAPVKNIGSWGEVKAQAAAMLGIGLVDADVFNAPKLETDLYGRFLRGPAGFPLMEMAVGPSVEGNPAAPISTANARRTGHGFLDDIAHNAAPKPGLVADGDTDVSVFGPGAAPQPAGTYDDELLNAHFVTGDGRGNENIALTSVHTVFHAEHNRLADKIHEHLTTPGFGLSADELAAWGAQSAQPPLGSGWDYGERLFQAARFVTEMEYQHLVFEEFARKISPSINAFIGDGINFQSNANPAISAEFAHQVYRLGHSMLTETIARTSATDEAYDIRLLDGFLNPLEFNRGADGAQLTAAQGAGAVFQGGTRQVASEIDEFVTDAVRNTLVGLPLDLAVLNMARGRSEGIPSLNSVRRQLYTASGDTQLVPYESWFDFSFSMRNPKSVVNFIAAYGTHPSITGATSVAAKRTAAELLADGGTGAPSDWPDFLFGTGAYANAANGATTTGLDNIDLWIGGLAERGNPFGGLLGSTFNYIFETQLESLQNLDRFYYLERLDGLNLLAQLEANSFSELISRNTTLTAAGADVFGRPDMIFHLAAQNVSGPIVNDPQTPDVDESAELVRMPNGTIRYPGDKHVIWVGRNDAIGDRVISSEGDDTLRGNGGNDVMEGGSGNDQHIGGDGDDILTDTFGDDVLKGGPGNDAINGGAGPFDLLQGNGGNDFIVGGIDDSEVFGGSGNDVIYMGKGISESFGGGGDDWIEGTDVPASVVVGDENDQFQNNPNGGHDILLAGPGDADFDSEGGDDIMVGNVVPTHRFEGMLGFDWATYRGETVAVDADMNITGAIAINAPLNEGRDRYDSIEALSGTDFNDLLRGDDRVEADLRLDPITEVVNGHVLTSAGIARISGLAALLPAGATEFAAGNIILGGAGSDLIEGRGGDDIIDGDAWLDVQLRGVLNPTVPGGVGEVKLANTHVALRNDVFAGRLNPGNITLVRAIRIAPVTTPRAIDSAVFSGPLANYTITENANGTVTVADNVGLDGVDTLRRIERAVFTDTTLVVNNVAPTGAPVLSQLRPQEGETLSASTAGIADENGLVGVVFNFRWQQRLNAGAFLNIAGARGAAATFTPTQAEVGRSLRVLVTFTDEGGALEFVVSAPTGVVGDVFVGTEANDTFAGTAGRDNASGLGGNDTLNTGNEDDVVLGGAGDDAINTGANNDIIRVDGGAGFDNVNGGTGTDRIEAMSAGTVIGLTALAGVESITANGFAGVTIQGSEAANTLSFAAVTLTNIGSINGGGGNDVLTGSALVDTINGGTGGDTVNGGAGNDVLRGDDGNDIVNGGTGDDNIAGNLGNDTINGDAGNDVISGGSEDDTILGGAGNDAIDGNDGDDTVTGGTGNDTMNAAAGNDVFVFNAAFNTDVINGFDTDEQQGQDELNLAALGITAANFNTNVTQVIQVVGGVSSMLITVRNPATGATLGTIRLNGVLRLGEVTPAGGSFILAP